MPWGVVATAAVSAYSSYSDQKDKDKARKDNKLDTAEGFNRENYLQQQQRKWKLEDRKYVEDATAGFRQYAPAMATSFQGKPFQEPTPTDTSGLANFDPNKPIVYEDPNKKPLLGSQGP